MSNEGSEVYPAKKAADRKFLVAESQYKSLYERSIEEDETFWAEQANMLDWTKPFSIVKGVVDELIAGRLNR